MMTNTVTLNDQQVTECHEDGYLIIRNVLSTDEIAEFRQYVQQQIEANAYPPSLKYASLESMPSVEIRQIPPQPVIC